jgi:DNA topoisomerase-1
LFRGKTKNAQEAHEAIRVTEVQTAADDMRTKSAKFTDRHAKLYDLIWRRFVASQMSEAVYDQTAIVIKAEAGANVYGLRSAGSVLRFDGWMRLFSSSADTILPDVQADQELAFVQESALQKFTQPPPRYNDASLVKELEKRGIGRPSTYASIISVIVDRGYVDRIDRRFHATPVGCTVSDFLLKHFPQIMDYDFTAEMEEDLDRISQGKKKWKTVVKEFYKPLGELIEKVKDVAERVQVPVEKTGEACPVCGPTDQGEVVIRSGRFGKFRSCSRFPDCKYTENIVEKLGDQKCPLCQTGDVIIKNSRWGKSFFGCSRYPECDWASWSKPEPDLKLTTAQWATMQAERKARAAKRRPAKKAAPKRKAAAKRKATPKRKTTSKGKSTTKNAKK